MFPDRQSSCVYTIEHITINIIDQKTVAIYNDQSEQRYFWQVMHAVIVQSL